MTDKRIVTFASAEQLSNEHYYRRLWLAARNVTIPRRAWLDELADTFRDFDGELRTPEGGRIGFPFVDDVFPDCEMRWISDYLEPARDGLFPKRRSRQFERLRMIDLYFRIKHPRIAAHFAA